MSTQPSSHSIEIPLYQLAHGRAGDKGNTSNISVIAWDAECFALLADQLTEQDVEDDARVIREAANATIIAYDPHLRKHVERPDHKTRLAATTLRRAYHEGLPVKREISLQANFESGESVIERIKASPEAMRMLGRMSVQKSPSIFEAEITGEPEPEK